MNNMNIELFYYTLQHYIYNVKLWSLSKMHEKCYTIAVTFTYSCNVSLQLHLSYLHVVYDIVTHSFLILTMQFYHQTKGKNRSFGIDNQQLKQSKSLLKQFKSKL